MSKIVERSKSKKVALTGITPSGKLHIGNYIGAIKPAIEMSKNPNFSSYIFIADYHSLVKLWNSSVRRSFTYEIAASWLALGLDPNRTVFYRQSDVPEIMQLNWILNSITPKGLLNRSHAYKEAIDLNINRGEKDKESGITMGLFNYPVLMAADIITFNADMVIVGKDQTQHIEIARYLANRFNYTYNCNLLKAPQVILDKKIQTIPGLDGRKMSKSYNNTIQLFAPSDQLKKQVMGIKTTSQTSEEPKDSRNCTIFSLYKQFSNSAEVERLKLHYKKGISWKESKYLLFEKMDKVLKPMRSIYEDLLGNRQIIDSLLTAGAEKARSQAKKLLTKVNQKVGV